MPCFVGCIALSAPRLAIVLVAIFSGYIGSAFETMLWPVLGFIFLPTSTLAYAWAINSVGGLEGIHLAFFIIALFIDLGLAGKSAKQGSRTCDSQA